MLLKYDMSFSLKLLDAKLYWYLMFDVTPMSFPPMITCVLTVLGRFSLHDMYCKSTSLSPIPTKTNFTSTLTIREATILASRSAWTKCTKGSEMGSRMRSRRTVFLLMGCISPSMDE